MTQTKDTLTKQFKMKILGPVKNYLGIEINFDRSKKLITLNQSEYIKSLASKYNIENAHLFNTPMETGLKIFPCETSDFSETFYRGLIGALLYVSINTRPDVAFSVNYLSRFLNTCSETHFKYALRILKYLYKTKDLSLTYSGNNFEKDDVLKCFVDSDWAGDPSGGRSTTGYVIYLYNNPIFWKSKKQSCIAKSSTEAEYIALSESVTEIIFIKNLANELFVNVPLPIKMFEDNSGAVIIANYGNLTRKSRHISIQYHFVHDNVNKKVISVIKCDSQSNVADILTKPLCKAIFEKMRNSLNLLVIM